MRSSRIITPTEVIIIVAVLVGGFVGFYFWPSSPAATPSPTPPSPTSTESINKVIPVSVDKLPSSFPNDIPLVGQSSSSVIENYNFGSLGHSVQATHEFESDKTVGESYDAYKKFFEDPRNSWTLLDATIDDADHNVRFIAARNADGVATVNITRNSGSGATLIEISFVPKSR